MASYQAEGESWLLRLLLFVYMEYVQNVLATSDWCRTELEKLMCALTGIRENIAWYYK